MISAAAADFEFESIENGSQSQRLRFVEMIGSHQQVLVDRSRVNQANEGAREEQGCHCHAHAYTVVFCGFATPKGWCNPPLMSDDLVYEDLCSVVDYIEMHY